MKYKIVILTLVGLFTVSCTTLDESIRLGGTMGMVLGAGATYASQSSGPKSASPEDVGFGASIGLALGLATAYFTHKSVTKNRSEYIEQTEVQFGDLSPTPFVFSNSPNSRGSK